MKIKNITIPEIIKKFEIDDNLNFICFAMTPWHAHSIDASLLYLQSKSIKTKGLCIIVKHPQTGYAVSYNHFISSFEGVYYLDYKQNFLINILQKIGVIPYLNIDSGSLLKKRTIYLLGSSLNTKIGNALFWNLKNTHIEYIVTDEGVGQYMDTISPQCPAVRRISDIKKIQYYVDHYLIEQKYASLKVNISYTTLFSTNNKGVLYNNNFIYNYYKDVFNIRYEATKSDLPCINSKNYVFICTTAWNRDKIKDNEDLSVWIELCCLLKKYGVDVVLKPHPRDAFFASALKNYVHIVFDNTISLETICCKYNPRAIIGISSTTLVTPSLFWNIKCFNIANLLDKSKLDIMYITEVDRFDKVFGNKVINIDSLDDIISLINDNDKNK